MVFFPVTLICSGVVSRSISEWSCCYAELHKMFVLCFHNVLKESSFAHFCCNISEHTQDSKRWTHTDNDEQIQHHNNIQRNSLQRADRNTVHPNNEQWIDTTMSPPNGTLVCTCERSWCLGVALPAFQCYKHWYELPTKLTASQQLMSLSFHKYTWRVIGSLVWYPWMPIVINRG